MTDNEIIKALECCSKPGWLYDCDGCPCYDEKEDIQTSECQERIMKNALDLINRQQAEIERLEIKIEGVQEANAILREHIKKAVKEFAERLKESKIDIDVSFGYGREVYTEAVAVVEIDNLVKEMVGE